jgi:N-acetylmuramoyl-L-alanine amidase
MDNVITKMKPTYIVVHHTSGTALDPHADTSSHSFETINEWHRQQFNMKSELGYYCGYQYFIDKDGKVTQARKDDEEGAHTIGRNKDSIGICLAGNFSCVDPTESQKNALRTLLQQKVNEHGIKIENINPHRKWASYKDCFGSRLKDDWAQSLVALPPSTKDLLKIKIGELQNLIEKL